MYGFVEKSTVNLLGAFFVVSEKDGASNLNLISISAVEG